MACVKIEESDEGEANMTSKKYVLEVARRLQCTDATRRELQKKVYSDVNRELEKGSTMEDVVQKFGTPKKLAEQLNANRSEEEVTAYKAKQKKNRITTAIVFLLTFTMMIWWWWPKNNSIEESEVFQKEVLMEQADTIATLVDQNQVEDICKISDQSLSGTLSAMTEEDWLQAKSQVAENWGTYLEMENVQMAEVTQMGTKIATVQMDAHYENITVHYTLTFNSEMKLTGLYMQ